MSLTARRPPTAGKDVDERQRCAAICGAAGADRGRRSDDGGNGDAAGSEEKEEAECGLDLEFSGFEEDVRLARLELDVGLAAGSSESLLVRALDEPPFVIDYYEVGPQER